MTLADITLTAFTLCNSLRLVAYVPQIAKAAADRSGAEAISLGTWGLFLVSHASAMAYALVNKNDWTMAHFRTAEVRVGRHDPGSGVDA